MQARLRTSIDIRKFVNIMPAFAYPELSVRWFARKNYVRKLFYFNSYGFETRIVLQTRGSIVAARGDRHQ